MADEVGTMISQLPLGENLADDDLMYAVEDGISKKVEVGYLKEVFDSGSDVSITPSIGSGTKVADYEIDGVAGSIYVPTAPTALSQLSDDSTHRVVTDTEKSTWNGKQNVLTFDDVPTDGSNNPVKSNGIYDAIEGKADASDVLNNYIALGHGKNIYNPALSFAGRLYSVAVGNEQIYTSDTTNVIQKIPIDNTLTYTIQNAAFYSLVDKNNKVVVPRTDVGTSITVSNIPSNVTHMWFQCNSTYSTTITQIETGNKASAYEPYSAKATIYNNKTPILEMKDLPALSNMNNNGVVNTQMTKTEFVAAIKSALSDFAALNKCFDESFAIKYLSVQENTTTWDFIYSILNHDFRKVVADSSMSKSMVCNNINNAILERIYRFCDAKVGNTRDYSLSTGFQADEPSAIVSEDGNTLYIYAHLKRISTTDGVIWSEPTALVLSNGKYIQHCNVNLIDGVYYLIGTDNTNLELYTSTDGINFTFRGILFKKNYLFNTGYPVTAWGNTYLIKDYGSNVFYLYVETESTGATYPNWVIHLATCTDIFYDNGDDTIGNWQNATNNPILYKPYRNISTAVSTAGNPDFAKASDNRPVKRNGKYYMYYHNTFASIAHIMRAYSYDLVNWTDEGVIFDNRDQPSAGDLTSGNADHCVIEFKGRTYLFYTWDINTQQYSPYIKYTIDDRSFGEVLEIKP